MECQLVALLRGCSIAMFDFAPNYRPFRMYGEKLTKRNLTYFGAGAAFFSSCMKAGIIPRKDLTLDKLRSIGAIHPLSQEGYRWFPL